MKTIIYNNYHKHSHYSNIATIDSITMPEDYINRALELGHSTYFSTEHRYGGNYLEAYELCKKANLKMIFGAEAYYVDDRLKKDRGNFHLVLIAKNKSGFKDINRVLSEANKTGFYYKARIDKNLLLSLNPENVWITTACIAGRLFKTKNYKEEFLIPAWKHFKDNLFLEVQSHSHPSQTEYNKKIIQLHNKYNIKLIHANDSHYIFPSDAKDRDLFLKGKNIYYKEEAGFVLDYPDSDTIFKRYKQQGVLTKKQVQQALENTLIFNEAEDLKFDKKVKMPTIYENQDANKILKNILTEKWKEERKKIPRIFHEKYIEAIKYEYDIVEKTNMADYFVLNEAIVRRAKELGGVLSRTGRGSSVSFYINKLLGFTEIDRIIAEVPLYPTRFMSISRILNSGQIPDIDMNWADPKPVIQASKELLGQDNIYYMCAYGKMKESSAFRNLCRAKDLIVNEYNEVAKNLDDYRDNPKWKDLIKESEKYVGVIESVSPSPCSFLLLNEPISQEIGLIRVGDELCTVIDGITADSFGYLKNDYLTVSVWEIISETFELINEPIPDIRELKEKLNENIWDLYKDGITVTLNQADSEWATSLVKKYKPHNIAEMTAFVAAIRPGFASLLNSFLSREDYTTNIKELDNILKDSFHYMLYQESIMKFLMWCDIKEEHTYDIIKKIAKKKFKEEELQQLKKELLKGFVNKVGSEEGFEEVWQVVEDASRYSFNASHALSMAYDSLYCAYLKANYPLEYYTVILNKYADNKEKTTRICNELPYFNINLKPIELGKSKAYYTPDKKTNSIYKGIASIKFLNAQIADELSELYSKHEYDNFIDLLIDIKEETSVNSRQLEILIKLNFFKAFGNNKKLMDISLIFDKFYKKCSIKKCKLGDYNISEDTIKLFAVEKPKTYMELNSISLIKHLCKEMPNKSLSIEKQLQAECEYLGYCETTVDIPRFDVCYILDLNMKYTPKATVYHLSTGEQTTYKVYKTIYDTFPFEENDLIYIINIKERERVKHAGVDDNGKNIWEPTGEKELILQQYGIVDSQKFNEYINKCK